MSKEIESKKLLFTVDLDEIICPACGLETLCCKEGHIQGKKVFQLHCCNPECQGKTFKVYVKIDFSKETSWQFYEVAK